MKRVPINPIGKVGKRRAANLARWKREHPRPDCCPLCGKVPDFRGLSVHHIKHRSQGGDESDDNLTWICGVCHDIGHGVE